MKTILKHSLLLGLLCLGAAQSQAADYYWIGGSGNWEDITRWATTSGGPVTHDQTPTANDNVIFDANSFDAANQVVTINSNVAFANDLDFTAATFTPTLRGGNNVVFTILGDFRLADNMVFDFTGTLFFAAIDADNTIDLRTHDAGTNVTFDGSGSWNVVSDLIMTSTLNFVSGDIRFLNNQVSCEFFYSRTNAVRALTSDNSTLTITGTTIDPQDDGREINIYTVRMNTDNLNWTSFGSQVNISADYAKILVEGSGSIDFGRLSTVGPDGSFALINLDGGTAVAVIDNLELTKNSLINSDISVGTLTLYPSYKYDFASDRTVNLVTLDAAGSCQAAIVVAATISGIPSNWIASQPIVGEFLTLSDIQLSGNAGTANNSIDQGNNAGWTINDKVSENFFWIGGTGNWNDGNHWALTSGGPASGCVPTAADDVFFDASSFNGAGQSVNINIANASCRSMVWDNVTNAPTLAGPEANNMLIYGSLTFDATMTHAFAGDYYFVGSMLGNTITTAGIPFNQDIFFNNVAGGWQFMDATYVELIIDFVSGTLNTNDQDVTCFRFYSEYKTDRNLSFGSSTINLIRRNNDFYNSWLDGDNLIFDAGTSTIIFNGIIGEAITRGNTPLTYHNIIFTSSFATLNSASAANIAHTFNKVTFLRDGQITGDNNIDTLSVNNGFTYSIGQLTEQNIDVLEWSDICDGLVTVRSFGDGTTIRLGTTTELSGFNISKITFDNNPNIIARESVDGGDNQGVTFEAASGRDLYWVGGSGDWVDQANWSTTSGGPGGECIPTIIDNVFFDDNSFTTTNDFIRSIDGNDSYCRNLTFSATGQTGSLGINRLEMSGNLDVRETWALPNIRMVGGFDPQTIRTSGSRVFNLDIQGTADVSLLDDLSVNSRILFFDEAFFTSNNFNIDVNSMSISNRAQGSPTIDMGTSLVQITGSVGGLSKPFVISGPGNTSSNMGQATFEFTSTNTGLTLASEIDMGTLLFSATNGAANLCLNTYQNNINAIIFRGDGVVNGNIGAVIDTLMLSSGKVYNFLSGISYTINDRLQALGNNCLPINWQSSQSGVDVELTIPDANPTILMDFVEMNGISVVCCNNYFAGNNSTNVGNSSDGWTFGTPDNTGADIGFLGQDIVSCDNSGVSLRPFESDQISSITWNDGSTDISFNVNNTSTVSALVVFTNNCQIRDTVDVRIESSFTIDLGPDTTLCDGASLLLNPNIAGADFEWQDMSSSSTFLVDAAGRFSVFADLGTCSASDTIVVNYQTPALAPLPETASGCAGDSILIDASINGASNYMWTDGSIDSQLNVKSTGTYIVTITEGACAIIDTTEITFFDNPVLGALRDTFVCDGLMVNVGPTTQNGFSYDWSTGAADAQIDIATDGRYTLSVTDENNCIGVDSLTLTVRPSPVIDLGNDTTICEGGNVEIGTDLIFDNYSWSTGSSQPMVTIDVEGDYRLTVEQNSCSYTDTLNLTLVSRPIVNFGMDRSICGGDSIILDATNTGATYNWNDGSDGSSLIIKDAGTYDVIVDLNGCTNADTLILAIDEVPFFDLGADQRLCEGGEVALNIPAGNNWMINWNTGATTDAITVTESDTYIAEAAIGGCTYSDTVLVNFLARPTVDFGMDRSICDGDSIILDATNTGATYNWNDGTTTPSIIVKDQGTYEVIVDRDGCIGGDTITVAVEPTPFFDLGSDQDLCMDESIDLMIPAESNWSINWNTGSTQSIISVDQTGTYTVAVILGNCSFTDAIDISIYPNPIVELGPDIEKCEQTSTILDVRLNDVSVLWNDGNTDPLRTIASGGTYMVEVETAQGCLGEDAITITDVTCVAFDVYLPNAFSPNNDGVNDEYNVGLPTGITISDYTFSVFDRWGNLVFQTADVDQGWDGTIQSHPVNMNAFLAVVNITYSDDFNVDVNEVIATDFMVVR